MSHVRALGFDALEARKLLTAAHIAAPHTTPMIVATPVVLNGTLTVDNNQVDSTTNADGSSTSSTPVAGRLGALGKVRGVWNTNLDEFGDPTGTDVLRLHAAKGSLIITFNTVNTVKPHPAAHGAVYYPRAQVLYSGTGAYSGATESGMIDLTTNHGRNQIVSLTLTSANA
jgi:hypothetical protein